MDIEIRDRFVDDFFNGTFAETFDALVTSDGSTITMSIEQSGGGDLTMQFSDGETLLDCTPTCTIELTAGTDASPQPNYIYIPQTTKVLTKSTSDFPTSAEHIKVAYCLVPSAVYIQNDGVYINQNWNDHLAGTDKQGHMSHIAERSRRDGAYYFSGVGPNGTDQSANTSYLDYVAANESYFKSTSGVVYQMHRHSIEAKDTRTNDVHVVNWNGDSYHDIHLFNDIIVDANGATLANRYFNLTFFGVGNKTGEYAPIMCNLPTGSYANQQNAEGDVDGFDVLTMPREFNLDSSTGFLICRMTLKYSGGTGTLEHASTVDLRGQTPSTATGGASGTTTEFADNQFAIFDEADVTKILNFDVGAISTGNTRTLQIPDASGIIALTSQTDGTITVADITDISTSYLAIDGSNANTTIDIGSEDLTTTGSITANNLNISNWNIAYTHSQDNTQAHTDYLINNGDDWTSGQITAAGGFLTQANVEATANLIGGALDIDTNAVIGGTITVLDDETTPYLITTRGGSFAIQSRTSSVFSGLELFSKDGDGSDLVVLQMFSKGTPASITNAEFFNIRCDSINGKMHLFSRALGTGTLRPVIIYTFGHDNQLYINTNGDVGINTVPDARFEVSTTTTEGHQAMTIDQNDIDKSFIDFQGYSNASASYNISTWKSGACLQGYFQIEINGCVKWSPYYSAPTGA